MSGPSAIHRHFDSLDTSLREPKRRTASAWLTPQPRAGPFRSLTLVLEDGAYNSIATDHQGRGRLRSTPSRTAIFVKRSGIIGRRKFLFFREGRGKVGILAIVDQNAAHAPVRQRRHHALDDGSCSWAWLAQVAKNEITTADAGEPLGRV